MPDPITVTVVEPKREPRPTYYGAINGDGQIFGPVSLHQDVAAWQAMGDGGFAKFTIPGERESARAARIEKARQAVIDAARDYHDCDLEANKANLRFALDNLTAAESEGAANG